MPGMLFGWLRRGWTTAVEFSPRSARAFSATNMRPVFGVGFGPPGPMVELTYWTALSRRRISATLPCSSVIAANEMSVSPWAATELKPVSYVGEKTYGTDEYE